MRFKVTRRDRLDRIFPKPQVVGSIPTGGAKKDQVDGHLMVVCFGVDQRRPISRPTWPIPLRSDLALLGCADDDVGLVARLTECAAPFANDALARGNYGCTPVETRPLANLPR